MKISWNLKFNWIETSTLNFREYFLALQLNLAKSCDNKTFKTGKKLKKAIRKFKKKYSRHETEKHTQGLLGTCMKNFFYPTFSNLEVYVNTQQTHSANGLEIPQVLIFQQTQEKQVWDKGVLHSKMLDSGESLDEIIVADAALSDDFLSRRRKNQKRLERFMLYFNFGLHLFSFS